MATMAEPMEFPAKRRPLGPNARAAVRQNAATSRNGVDDATLRIYSPAWMNSTSILVSLLITPFNGGGFLFAVWIYFLLGRTTESAVFRLAVSITTVTQSPSISKSPASRRIPRPRKCWRRCDDRCCNDLTTPEPWLHAQSERAARDPTHTLEAAPCPQLHDRAWCRAPDTLHEYRRPQRASDLQVA
jgi:hypothetical protein